MPETTPAGDDDAIRAALQRALAERADMENSRLDSAPAEPPTGPRAPVPGHRSGR